MVNMVAMKFGSFDYSLPHQSRLLPCLALCLCIFTSIISVGHSLLYNQTDKVIRLDASNFEDNFYGQKWVWFMQFYNRWCGHCANFAPIWKELAEYITDWYAVIQMAVMDCAEDENIELCSRFHITYTPNLRLFQPNAQPGVIGDVAGKQLSKVALMKDMIAFLRNYTEFGNKYLQPYNETTFSSLQSLPAQHVAVVFDSSYVKVGVEVILAVSAYQNLAVFYVPEVDNNPLVRLAQLKTLPALVHVKPDLRVEYPESEDEAQSDFIRSLIAVGGTPMARPVVPEIKPMTLEDVTSTTDVSADRTLSDNTVYMVDLEGALRYSLRHEVVLQPSISGDKLDALKSYVNMLVEAFPGRLPVMNFLKLVAKYLGERSEVTGKEMSDYMKAMESPVAYLPGKEVWKGCLGSSARYRRYPCSMWTMFHTQTVNDALTLKKNKVLSAMLGYIKNFFGCRKCSEHFQKMAAEDGLIETKSADQSVLWLWKAHNKVNKRLHGDVTEDPKHITIQFPSAEACPACQSSSGMWQAGPVRHYLESRYKKDSISMEDVYVQEGAPRTTTTPITTTSGATVALNEDRRKLHPKISYGNLNLLPASQVKRMYYLPLSATDMSLCVMLYLSSAALIIVGYFLFIVKKKYRRKLISHLSLNKV